MQSHLGDVVFAELPEGGTATAGKAFASVESVKATSDVNSPISGEIVEVNTKLSDSPGLVSPICCSYHFTQFINISHLCIV